MARKDAAEALRVSLPESTGIALPGSSCAVPFWVVYYNLELHRNLFVGTPDTSGKDRSRGHGFVVEERIGVFQAASSLIDF